MTGLVDAHGRPLSSSFARPKKNDPANPLLGEIAPGWNEERKENGYTIARGTNLIVDTSNLTLTDYRAMRDHYQINSSLSVLMFMIHQADYKITGGAQKKHDDHVQDNIDKVWSRLVRAFSQAFWAGFSPCATQWENDDHEGKVMLTKIKDLPPEDCEVNWKNVPAVGEKSGGKLGPMPIDHPSEGTLRQVREKMRQGSTKGRARIFDGIVQHGSGIIPASNSLWYPILMENGNYYGRKLLNTAYQSWFFSLLIHMYSNRYFERFGEPVPVARAPYDDEITVNGTDMKGNKLMQIIARQFRNGSAVVLPNNRIMNGTQDTDMFEYSLEFLESQLRGADFDRYLQRLDEEISLALFTPLLLMRTGSGGSFNLGVGHMQMFQWQINALMSDMKEYIDKYIIRPMMRLNFPGENTMPEIKFRPLGRTDPETLRAVALESVRSGRAKPDLEELGQALGMKFEEIEIVLEPPTEPGSNPDDPEQKTNPGSTQPARDKNNIPRDKRSGRPERSQRPKGSEKRGKLAAGMADRVSQQYKAGRKEADIGFWSQYHKLLVEEFGVDEFSDSIGEHYDELTDTIDRLFVEKGLEEIIGDCVEDAVEYNLARVEDAREKQPA